MKTVRTKKPSHSRAPSEAATSTPREPICLVGIVESNAKRQAKSPLVREYLTLNRVKLFSSCAAEYKSLLGMEKTERLDTEQASKLSEAIDAFILKAINQVTPMNVKTVSKSFKHDSRNMGVVEAVRVTGENILALKEQSFGITLLINAQEKRLAVLRDKPTPNHEAEENAEKSIARLKMTQMFIKAQIEQQEKEQSK